MAPEQLEGKEADARTDVFAFGAVVYELITGKKAFEGKSQLSVMTAILEKDPAPLSNTQSMSPPQLDYLVKTCLEKSPDQRWQSAGDIGRQLAWIAGADKEPTARPTDPLGGKRSVIAGVIAVVLVGIAGFAVWMLTEEPVKPVSRFVISTAASEPLEITTDNTDVAISPDGSMIAYVATSERQLFLRRLDRLEATPLHGTEGGYTPFFSPDGQWIGYRDWDDSSLSKVSVSGGPPLDICELPPANDLRGASWGLDDNIIVGETSESMGLLRVPAGGGELEVITEPDADNGEVDHRWPDILPGGQAVLFTVFTESGESRIAVLSLASGEQKELIRGGSHPRYVPTGHIVYGVDNSLRAVSFDLDRLEVTSNPIPVLDGVITKRAGAADFSLAENGSLVYVSGSAVTSKLRNLVWVDREGREAVLGAEPKFYVGARLSPDGARVAVVVREERRDVWTYDLTREASTRVTFDYINMSPIWTPDGHGLVFRSKRDAEGFFEKAADGAGGIERLTASIYSRYPQSFHPDGKHIVFRQNSPETFQDLGMISIADDGEPLWISNTEYRESSAAISPDGRWVAYQSDESGEDQIYVRPLPDFDAGKWLVSADEGEMPVWNRNGRELFYVGPRLA